MAVELNRNQEIKKLKKVILFTVLIVFLMNIWFIEYVKADSNSDAGKVCQAIRNLGDSRVKCSVNVSKEISVIMHASKSEANKMCDGMVSQIVRHTHNLSGWKIQIYSMIGRKTLATCWF